MTLVAILAEPSEADERNNVTDSVPTNEYAPSSVFVNLHALVSAHYTNPATVGRYRVEPTKWLDEHREACGLPSTFSGSHFRELLLQTRANVPEFSVQQSDGHDDAYFIAFFPLDAVLERLHQD